MTDYSNGELLPGDVVVLKSNQALSMTVEHYNYYNGHADCVWFDDKQQLQRASFRNSMLKRLTR